MKLYGKEKTCFYLACLTVGSLAATMVLVLIYKFAYFNVYGIDITHCIGFNRGACELHRALAEDLSIPTDSDSPLF